MCVCGGGGCSQQVAAPGEGGMLLQACLDQDLQPAIASDQDTTCDELWAWVLFWGGGASRRWLRSCNTPPPNTSAPAHSVCCSIVWLHQISTIAILLPAKLQADVTLEELLSDEAVLQRLLAPLGGGTPAAAAAAGVTSDTPQQQQQESSSGTAAVNGVQQQLHGLDVNGITGSSSSNGSGSNGIAAAAAGSSSSSWRDPDDGVREALAETIAVLVSITTHSGWHGEGVGRCACVCVWGGGGV